MTLCNLWIQSTCWLALQEVKLRLAKLAARGGLVLAHVKWAEKVTLLVKVPATLGKCSLCSPGVCRYGA